MRCSVARVREMITECERDSPYENRCSRTSWDRWEINSNMERLRLHLPAPFFSNPLYISRSFPTFITTVERSGKNCRSRDSCRPLLPNFIFSISIAEEGGFCDSFSLKGLTVIKSVSSEANFAMDGRVNLSDKGCFAKMAPLGRCHLITKLPMFVVGVFMAENFNDDW